MVCVALQSCIGLSNKKVTIIDEYDHADQYIAASEGQATDVKKINIDWIDGDIVVESYEGDAIAFAEKCDSTLDAEQTLHYWVDNEGELHIHFAKSGTNVHGLSKKLTIKIPHNFDIHDMEIETVSSDIFLSRAPIRDIKIETVSGSADINMCDSNTLHPSANMSKEIEMESVSGNMSVSLPKGYPYSMNFESVSGQASLPSKTFKGMGEHKFNNGVGGVEISAETVSGNLTIKEL